MKVLEEKEKFVVDIKYSNSLFTEVLKKKLMSELEFAVSVSVSVFDAINEIRCHSTYVEEKYLILKLIEVDKLRR